MKRLLSLLLIAAMCITLLPASVLVSAEQSISTGAEALSSAESAASGTELTVSYTDGKNFTNPVANGADPFVFKDTDGTYYLYTTNAGGNGYIAYTSRDLVNWSSIGYVLSKTDVSVSGVDTLTNFWAPEVSYYDGKYYMIVTVNEHLLVATGDSPAGPFSTPENYSYIFENKAIDGHLFFDDDGKVYLYYVVAGYDSYLAKSGNVIWGCEFNMSTLKPVSGTEKRLVWAAQSWENSSGHNVAEGPEVFKRNGKYYMLYTANGYTYAYYAVGAATATTPLGSYTKQTSPILVGSNAVGAVGVGHCCYTYSPDNTEMWMVYHKHAGLNQIENREICLDKITFDSSGKVHVAASYSDGKPTMTAQKYPSGAVSTVKDAKLDSDFAKLATLPTVYVHMNDGSDTAKGTETAPYKTLERAYAALTPNGGTIVLISSHDISQQQSDGKYLSPESQIAEKGNYFETPAGITGPIMLRGRNPGIRLRFSYITLNSDHYIDNLMLRPNVIAGVIECGFNNVTFGENLSVSPAYDTSGNNRYPILVGGYYQCGSSTSDAYPYKLWTQSMRPYEKVSTSEDYTISVYGGTWRSIMGGNWRTKGDASLGLIDADVTLNLGGSCVVAPLYSGTSEMNYLVSVTSNTALSSRGTATLNITGGTYNCPVFVSGRLGSITAADGVTHSSEHHAGDLFCNISGGKFVSTTINGTLRNAIISATQDSTNNVTADYTLTVRSGAEFEGSVGFYSTNGSKKVTGTTAAHIANEINPIFTSGQFTSYDFFGNEGPVSIYINQSTGDDTNSGLTPEDPVQNLSMAYKMMTPYGGTVTVMEHKIASVSSYYCAPECGGPVTIRGLTSDVQWQIDYFSISSEHIFDNITIYSRGTTSAIECKFNDLTIKESVKTDCASAGRYAFIVGGHCQQATSSANFNPTKKTQEIVSTDKDYTITVNGGTWRSVRSGNWRLSGAAHVGSIDGNVTVNLGKSAVVAPVVGSGENYFVSASGNNASNGGTFTLNINGASVNAPIFGASRLGAVNSALSSEYRGFSADVYVNINGAEIGIFADGETYEQCYIAAQQTDDTAPDIDGTFMLRMTNVTVPAGATVSGVGASVSHAYSDVGCAVTPTGFSVAGAYNSRGNVIADGNGDSILSNADVTLMVRGLVGDSTMSVEDNDLDGNGKINNRDAIALAQIIAGWNVVIVQ